MSIVRHKTTVMHAPAKKQNLSRVCSKKTSRKAINVQGSKKIVADFLPGFSKKLSAMLTAGMPIVAALKALQRQCHNPNFKKVIQLIREEIENGESLSDALHRFPSIFSDLYVNMIRGGEVGGKLPETIARLAMFLEASSRLRKKIKSAMIYPVVVLSIALIIATLMIIFIVPVFGAMFESFDAKLPGATAALMIVSEGMRQHGLVIVISVFAFVLTFKYWKKTSHGAYTCDQIALRIPVFGELTQNIASARFARTFAQLIHSGVPILSALEISSGATGNNIAEEVVLSSRKMVERGEPLSKGMMEQTVFPEMFVEMLQVGESTGKVDEMMDFIADYYEEEVNDTINSLTSLLEPVLMIFLGIIIGGIVVCMFLPLFQLPTIFT